MAPRPGMRESARPSAAAAAASPRAPVPPAQTPARLNAATASNLAKLTIIILEFNMKLCLLCQQRLTHVPRILYYFFLQKSPWMLLHLLHSGRQGSPESSLNLVSLSPSDRLNTNRQLRFILSVTWRVPAHAN